MSVHLCTLVRFVLASHISSKQAHTFAHLHLDLQSHEYQYDKQRPSPLLQPSLLNTHALLGSLQLGTLPKDPPVSRKSTAHLFLHDRNLCLQPMHILSLDAAHHRALVMLSGIDCVPQCGDGREPGKDDRGVVHAGGGDRNGCGWNVSHHTERGHGKRDFGGERGG